MQDWYYLLLQDLSDQFADMERELRRALQEAAARSEREMSTLRVQLSHAEVTDVLRDTGKECTP